MPLSRSSLSSIVFVVTLAAACSGSTSAQVGALSLLGVATTAADAHCVTADASGNAYACDPGHGQVLKYKDAYPVSQ